MFFYQLDLPEIHTVLQELRDVTNAYPLRVLVGETDRVEYYGNGTDELHLVFNFPLMRTERLTPAWIRENQSIRLAELPPTGWPCNTLGNHDSSRLVSHFSDGLHNIEIARIGLVLMLTLKGTPFLYNGEEIGMTDLILKDIHQFRDMLGVWAYETEIEQLDSSPEAALIYAARHTRDKCRTPMQWANQPNGGFCPPDVQPWLPVNSNYAEGVNVEDQQQDPDSLFNFYKRLLSLRKLTPALIDGDYESIDRDAPGYLGYLRHSPSTGQTCLVVINMTNQSQQTDLNITSRPWHILYTSHPREEMQADPAHLHLAPFEIVIGELK
jgi:alpha-glucosidase